MRPLVLYHAGCWDGFCAAWVAHKKLGDEADYIPVQYGTAPPDVTDRNVYILDFSYPLAVTELLAAAANRIVIIDHHKTAESALMAFNAHNVIIEFDMRHSGGRLTWEWFFHNQTAPWLVDYTEDRDLWRWALPESKAVNAALRSYPLDFAMWDRLAGTDLAILAMEGQSILRREQQIVSDHVRHAREVEMDGHKILAVNATVLFSEIAGELAKGRPFGAAWFQRADGKTVWSLRSAPDGIDVSEVAKRHGGGGHKHAAGYEE